MAQQQASVVCIPHMRLHVVLPSKLPVTKRAREHFLLSHMRGRVVALEVAKVRVRFQAD